MRPLRAFAALLALLGCWSGWRFSEVRGSYAALIANRGPTMAVRGTEVAAPRLRLELVAMDEPVGVSPDLSSPPDRGGRGIAPAVVAADARMGSQQSVADNLAGEREPAAVFALASRRDDGRAAGPSGSHAAHRSAEAAYRALAAGDRRRAAAAFGVAVAEAPDHPNAGRWTAELRALRRRWSLDAYTLIRDGGGALAVSSQPLLGGGQSGLRAGYMLNPLAARPVEVYGRFNIAQDWLDPDGSSAQAAFGAAWRPFGLRGPSLSAERMIGVGGDARSAWAARIAGGAAHVADARLPLDLSGYAEAGIAGLRRGDLFAGGQAYALYPVAAGRTRVAIGAGGWGSVQDAAGGSAARVEVGPAAQITRAVGGGAVELRAEYRQRIAGDAAPGSGAVVTVATRF